MAGLTQYVFLSSVDIVDNEKIGLTKVNNCTDQAVLNRRPQDTLMCFMRNRQLEVQWVLRASKQYTNGPMTLVVLYTYRWDHRGQCPSSNTD